MILRQTLELAVQALQEAKIEDSFIEAELLLSHVLGLSKTQIYMELNRDLTSAEVAQLNHVIRRRLNREPISYIRQECEFYGFSFYISPGVFIPRPETEVLVEEALDVARYLLQYKGRLKIADIGTGCGAIAISLALALPQSKVYATDISSLALQVAKTNCQRHRVDNQVELLLGNLLEPLSQPVDMIVANLPYIREDELEQLSPEIVNFEPKAALLGGKDGLEEIGQLVKQAPEKVNFDGVLLLEIGQGQGEAVRSLLNTYFPEANIQIIPDLGGIDRVVKVALDRKVRESDKSIS